MTDYPPNIYFYLLFPSSILREIFEGNFCVNWERLKRKRLILPCFFKFLIRKFFLILITIGDYLGGNLKSSPLTLHFLIPFPQNFFSGFKIRPLYYSYSSIAFPFRLSIFSRLQIISFVCLSPYSYVYLSLYKLKFFVHHVNLVP